MNLLNFVFSLILIVFTFQAFAQKSERQIDLQVQKLIKSMSLAEKCGEMTQLTVDVLMQGDSKIIPEPQSLSVKKLKKVLVDLNVGSILNVAGHTLSRDRWLGIHDTIQFYATQKKKSGIPVLYGIDAIHGTTYTVGGTLFPQQIAQAATWNPDLVRAAASVTAYETRASGIPWNFSPVLDIGRFPLWPRFWETFGEDVFLTKTLAKEMIIGYQGKENDLTNPYKVAACLKHFYGYSVPFSGKDRTPAYIPERQLREYFLPSFEAALDQGALTIMINSGEINGIPVHADDKILTDLLRNELGFEGIALTDWKDIIYLYTRHKVAKDHKDAIRIAINAGVDMSMVPLDTQFPLLLKELVEEGAIAISRINEAVSRILKVKFKLGLFENPTTKHISYDDFGSEKHQQIALNTALEAITLLKNDNNKLPLSKDQRILVCGPNANSLNALNGGWTHTWQGVETKFNAKGKASIYEALTKDFFEVNYALGSTFDTDENINYTKNAARNADAIIVCLGESPYTEFVGNIDDLDLPQSQYDLVDALAETGKPIILVLVEGRPRIIRQIADKVDAVVMAYLPGNEGGTAISKILAGDVNPSGKLPFTYPSSVNDLQTYDHKYSEGLNFDLVMNTFRPQYEFGSGLSYTSFNYSNLKISKDAYSKEEMIRISVDVENTGDRSGKEVVQLYISDLVASITPSVKRLRGFVKVALEPDDIATIKFNIKPEELAFVGRDLNWILEPGDFEIEVGGLKEKFILKFSGMK